MTGQDDVWLAAPEIEAALRRLLDKRLVFFAGMPATGKSLLTNRFGELAHGAGRRVCLLQWDIARLGFESSQAAAAYPVAGGITHPVVRRAVGLWAREKVASWASVQDEASILVGEAPLVGNRLVELVRKEPDAAEVVLAAPSCRFVLVLPSDEVRRHIEAERRRRFAAPRNPQELEDAPPDVLPEMWRELVAAGRQLGVEVVATPAGASYEHETYRAVYERLLRHRNVELLPVDTVLPARDLSAYDYGFPYKTLTPTPDEAIAYIHRAEEGDVVAAVERWWDI